MNSESLTGLVESTSTKYDDARIVVTSSMVYKISSGLDYETLATTIPGDLTWA